MTPTPRDKLLDVIVALLLALATIGSAWCAYQASRRGGVEAYRYDRAQTLRLQATNAAAEAMTRVQIDASLFVQWVAAASRGNDELAGTLRQRFRPELRSAFEEWYGKGLAPTEGKGQFSIPAGTPFDNPAYASAARQESVRLDKDGDQETRDAKRANQTSDNFVFGVVLYTIVLSISGVAPKLISVRVRRLVLFISIVVLISATALTLRLPMDVRAVGVRPWLSRLEVSASGLTFAQ